MNTSTRKPSKERVLETLRYDALSEAERCTGKSYKEDKDTEALGVMMHLRHVQHVNDMLVAAGDTSFSRDAGWTLNSLKQAGFVVLLKESFAGEGYHGEPAPDERFYILFCERRGILVTMETYGRGSETRPEGGVNTLKFYLNWRPNTPDSQITGYSGHCIKDPGAKFVVPENKAWEQPAHPALAFVVGYDGREGMFSRLQQLEETGEFITPWLEAPFLWLLTYMDTKPKGYDHKAITAARIAKLPESVQAAIKGQPQNSDDENN